MKLKVKQANGWEFIEVDLLSFMKCYFIMTFTIYGILICLYIFILIIAMFSGMVI